MAEDRNEDAVIAILLGRIEQAVREGRTDDALVGIDAVRDRHARLMADRAELMERLAALRTWVR